MRRSNLQPPPRPLPPPHTQAVWQHKCPVPATKGARASCPRFHRRRTPMCGAGRWERPACAVLVTADRLQVANLPLHGAVASWRASADAATGSHILAVAGTGKWLTVDNTIKMWYNGSSSTEFWRCRRNTTMEGSRRPADLSWTARSPVPGFGRCYGGWLMRAPEKTALHLT